MLKRTWTARTYGRRWRMATGAPNYWTCARGPLKIVRSGTGPSGSAAVRAFQRAVLTRTLATVKNYSLTNAIAESTLRRDGNGNPAQSTRRDRAGRIDVLSAAVLAVGEAALCPAVTPDDRLHTQPGRRIRLIPPTFTNTGVSPYRGATFNTPINIDEKNKGVRFLQRLFSL